MTDKSVGPKVVEVTHKIVGPAGAIKRIDGLDGIHDGRPRSMTTREFIAEARKS